MPSKEYHCDCQEVCKGIRTKVSRGTFRWHEKYRRSEATTSTPPSFRAIRQEAGIGPKHPSHPPPDKRRKNQSTNSEPPRSTTPFSLGSPNGDQRPSPLRWSKRNGLGTSRSHVKSPPNEFNPDMDDFPYIVQASSSSSTTMAGHRYDNKTRDYDYEPEHSQNATFLPMPLGYQAPAQSRMHSTIDLTDDYDLKSHSIDLTEEHTKYCQAPQRMSPRKRELSEEDFSDKDQPHRSSFERQSSSNKWGYYPSDTNSHSSLSSSRSELSSRSRWIVPALALPPPPSTTITLPPPPVPPTSAGAGPSLDPVTNPSSSSSSSSSTLSASGRAAPASVQQVLSVAFEAQLKANTSTSREGSDSTLLDDNTTSVSTGAQKNKRKRKEPDINSVVRPSTTSTTARNLCLIDWCKLNKGGLLGQFNAYWSELQKNKEPLYDQYTQRASTAKATKKQAAASTGGCSVISVEGPNEE
ncbi:hypothetical protein BU15DRAFT_71858 [Melanogaster broomeanus]|nr:hypothetical protein BU15DRAFT_71858 [Melanogaster broomeanus]